MSLKKDNYLPRLIDKTIDRELKTFGAICIEGPKWCGKTWTSLAHANSVFYVGDPAQNFNNRELARMNTENVFKEDYPELIDEWLEVPAIWDAVRFKVDQDKISGKYILTGSVLPVRNKFMHSGVGIIKRIRMYPMSLYESGDSTGEVSLKNLFDGKFKTVISNSNMNLDKIIYLILRGGWPENIGKSESEVIDVASSYIENTLLYDINKVEDKERDVSKIRKLIASLARNESTLVTNETLIKDIKENDNSDIYRDTIKDYIEILKELFIIEDQEAFSSNIRSKARIRNTPKKHFIDPSLACATLNLSSSKLKSDLNTLGFMFEGMCYRDLCVYAESLNGKVYQYRDGNGLEIDNIIELKNGDFGAFEVKLGANQIDDAAKNLIKFSKNVSKKPKVLCVIVGDLNSAYRRDDGVYVVPIGLLKD